MWRIGLSFAGLLGALFGAHFCFAQLTATGIGGGDFAGAGATTTTWNPSDKDTGITLSGGNLVATSSTTLANCSVSGFCGVRAIASHSTGKFYYELVVTTLGNAPNDDNVGIANASYALNAALGTNNNSNALRHGGGNTGGSTCPDTPAGFVSGDVLSIAADLTGNLMWFRTNAGSWNNSGGAADPASGTRGCDISTLAGGPYFPAISGSNDANTVFTANFGGSAYAESVPAGFGNW